jgi:predicted nucleotidyltransferase
MKPHIAIPREQVNEFCKRWKIDELALFGSVLHDGFRPDSDVDILVRFHPDARHSLFDMARMQNELQDILGRKVDLVSRRAIEMSRNHIRKKAILDSAEIVYGT